VFASNPIWFDKCMYRLVMLLHRKGVVLEATTSRWGLVSILSTLSVSLIAIAIGLWAAHETGIGGLTMVVFMLIVAAIGVISAILTACFGIYFLRNQPASKIDLLIDGFVNGVSDGDITKDNIGDKIKVVGEKLGSKTKTWLDETQGGRDTNAKP